MKVRKIDETWEPAEHRGLQVGEIVDITDPKSLILQGRVEAVGEQGETITAFELYGVLTEKEEKEFRDYLLLKRAKEANKRLTEENEKLKQVKDAIDAKKDESPKEGKQEVKTKTSGANKETSSKRKKK